MTKVSVVMSVHNGERYLSEAIKSILWQTFRDFEFIIVDDGSSDSTAEILSEFSRQDSRIQAISLKTNMGLPHGLNLGIKQATGDIIARMDCDDISAPERFERQLTAMKDTGADVLGTFAYRLRANGTARAGKELPASEEEISNRLPFGNCIVHPSVMMRKKVLEEVGGYDEEYLNSQDYDLWLRLKSVARIQNLKEPLVGYRKHNERISAKKNKGKQTHFSVCAALNYFRAAFDMDRISPKESHLRIATGLCEVMQAGLNDIERKCVNRHIIRYARNSVRDRDQRNMLKEVLFETATLREKCKWQYYQLIG